MGLTVGAKKTLRQEGGAFLCESCIATYGPFGDRQVWPPRSAPVEGRYPTEAALNERSRTQRRPRNRQTR